MAVPVNGRGSERLSRLFGMLEQKWSAVCEWQRLQREIQRERESACGVTGDDDGAKGVLVTGVVPARKRVGRRKALLLKKKMKEGERWSQIILGIK